MKGCPSCDRVSRGARLVVFETLAVKFFEGATGIVDGNGLNVFP